MNGNKSIAVLVLFIVLISVMTTSIGIFSKGGEGNYNYRSIRGQEVTIYGNGLYRHMSADVAIQGIAQDVVTLLIGNPLLLISLFWASRGSVKGRFLLAGTLGYFFVTYLLYIAMAMYNKMFLAYSALLALSFFGLVTTLLSFDANQLPNLFKERTPVRFVGGFLIFNVCAIALLWLSIVVPPLTDGTIYPVALEHYTTLIVQGFDLGLFLPMALVSAILFLKKRPLGYLFTTTYMVFLSILMTALTAKIIAMALAGVNVIPVIFIIPTFNILSIVCAFLLFINLRELKPVVK